MSSIDLVITYPNPHLREVAKEVLHPKDASIKALIPKMIQAMKFDDGIGLAAPQIDVQMRVIVVDTQDGPMVFINPELSKKSFRKSIAEEGCLSVPTVYGLVKRHESVHLDALNEAGERLSLDATGLFARVLQHEIDHLNGVLFIDRAIKYTKGGEPAIAALKKSATLKP